MLRRTERILENIPVGSLGLISLTGCEELGKKVDDYLVKWRHESGNAFRDDIAFSGYEKDSYLLDARVPRFGSGEAKGVLGESVRGKDLYLMVDVCNYSITYSLAGKTNHMSPDDHFQNLKRIIAAIGGKGRRINVIMPFLYESRQHKRSSRESLDCALALQELVRMGVENIITFDAHDPRVQNAIPLSGFETVSPTYQFIKGLLRNVKDLQIDADHMMAISPDEGGTNRAVYLANVLGLDMGMFYKRRDYTKIVDGRNPIVAHEFLGSSVEGKDVIIIDDMISSGDSIIDVATELKQRKANRIFAAATFGLFTNGMEKFDKAYEDGIIHGILTTNLIYQTPELLSKPYYINCDMSKYIALIIDTLNHDGSLSSILSPNERIQHVLQKYKNGELFKNNIVMLPQDPKSLFVKKTVKEELEEMETDSDENRGISIERVISLCGIKDLLNHHPYDLSGGEQQRTALAKVLLTDPKILLLDEPTKGMDNFFKIKFAELLNELKEKGVTIIMVSHDIEFCAKYADNVSLFFDGSIITSDTPDRFFSHNSFYTTAANRMSRHIFSDAVTNEDVIRLCQMNR